MHKKLYFTKRGIKKIKQEIEELEKKLRNLQAQTTHVAEVGGDQWHDNASYDMLIIDIRGVDRRLADAHRCLNQAVVVDCPSSFNRVAIGTQVKIVRDDKEVIWEIVGFGESDPSQKLLAYNTPIASLLMGKCKGELVSGVIAGKQIEIEILEISKGEYDNANSS